MNCEVKLVEEEDELEDFLQLVEEIYPNDQLELSEDDLVFLAYSNSEPVGFIHFGEDEHSFSMKSFGIRFEFQKQGLEKVLIHESSEQLPAKPIYLKTNTLNPEVHLYSDCGFFVKRFGGNCILEKRELN